MVKVFVAASAILLLVGCHGTDLRLGTGRSHGASLDASGSTGGWKGSDWSVSSDDDVSSYWVEVGFQLTPASVRYLPPQPSPSFFPPPVLGCGSDPGKAADPPTPAPGPSPDPGSPPGLSALVASVDELAARVEENSAALLENRERMDRSLGPIEILLGGGGLSVAAVLSFLGVRAFRRRAGRDAEGGL